MKLGSAVDSLSKARLCRTPVIHAPLVLFLLSSWRQVVVCTIHIILTKHEISEVANLPQLYIAYILLAYRVQQEVSETHTGLKRIELGLNNQFCRVSYLETQKVDEYK